MGLSARAKAVLPSIDREFVLRFAAEALLNCYNLRAAGHLLFRAGQYGPASSLAISAREEVGKFYLGASSLTGTVDKERFVQSIFSHQWKQIYAKLVIWLAPFVSHLIVSPMPTTESPRQRASDFIRRLDIRGRWNAVGPLFWPLAPILSNS